MMRKRYFLVLLLLLGSVLAFSNQSHGPEPVVLRFYQNDASDYNTNNDGLDCIELATNLRITRCVAYTGSGTVSVQAVEKADPSAAGDSIFFLDTAITADTDGQDTSAISFDPSGTASYDILDGAWLCLQLDGAPGAVEVGLQCEGTSFQ